MPAPAGAVARRVAAGFFACAAPDLDFVASFAGPVEYLLNHRGVTHSLLLMPAWAIGVAWLLAKVLREAGGWRALVCRLPRRHRAAYRRGPDHQLRHDGSRAVLRLARRHRHDLHHRPLVHRHHQLPACSLAQSAIARACPPSRRLQCYAAMWDSSWCSASTRSSLRGSTPTRTTSPRPR